MANPDDPLQLIALAPKPDIEMTAETATVVLEPGGTGRGEVSIKRNNEFGGRVPVEVRNLPPRRAGDRRRPERRAAQRKRGPPHASRCRRCPDAEPIDQPIVLSGKIETRADAQQTSYASEPILLSVKPKTQVSGTMAGLGNRTISQRIDECQTSLQ